MIRNLDPILTAAQPGQTIQLERGLYTTMGVTSAQVESLSGPIIKSGVTIKGHAEGTQVICVRAAEGPEVSVLYGIGEGIQVSGLLVDCGPASPINKRNGVYLEGKKHRVSEVHVRRSWGSYSRMRESFGISVPSSAGSDSTIHGCSVLEIQGDYQTAMQGEKISFSNVEFPKDNSNAFRVAYNVGASSGARVLNCTSRWAHVGIYWDWEDCLGLQVSGCTFYGCRNGLYLNAQQLPSDTKSKFARDIEFAGNDILLNPDLAEVAAFQLVHSTPDGIYKQDNTLHAISNVTISGNRVRFLPGEVQTRVRYASNVSSFLDPSKRSAELGITGVKFVDNDVLDTDGLLWRNWRGNAEISGTIKREIEFQHE